MYLPWAPWEIESSSSWQWSCNMVILKNKTLGLHRNHLERLACSTNTFLAKNSHVFAKRWNYCSYAVNRISANTVQQYTKISDEHLRRERTVITILENGFTNHFTTTDAWIYFTRCNLFWVIILLSSDSTVWKFCTQQGCFWSQSRFIQISCHSAVGHQKQWRC